MVVDKYALEAELGAGGHATVWLARHQVLGSLHAVKCVHGGGADRARRLVQEGRIQARLDHPNIVPVVDVVQVQGGPALVMPFVAGPSLAVHLAAGPLPLDEALRIGLGILEGLAFAHANGVVHRDLKPSNILLSPSPSGLVPRITDFGIAQDTSREGPPLTATGIALGTLAYMSPEQARSARDVDARADVFSFGCVLYELITGRRAFPGSDPIAVATAAATGHFASPRAVDPTLPTDLDALVCACLAPARDHRPPTAAVRSALAAVAAGRALTWEGPSVTLRTPRRRSPWVVPGAVASLAFAAAGAGWAAWPDAVAYPHDEGYALRLDGKSWLEVAPTADLDLGGPVTLAAWLYPEVFHYGEAFPVFDRIWRLEASLRAISFTAARRTGTAMPHGMRLGAWMHVAVTWHPSVGTARWFEDGVLVHEETYREPYVDFSAEPPTSLHIGSGPYGRPEFAHGYFDDLRIWGRELSPDEVRAVASGRAFDRADLIAEWTFDEGRGDVVPDRSGHGHAARVRGAPAWVAATDLP